MYGPFTNEQLLGKALKGNVEGVKLATKVRHSAQQRSGFRGINGRPEYVKQACDASLQRLGCWITSTCITSTA
jgi:aryl-alcohol dehydrogenase-like predicted oxidoreductase